MRRLFDVATVKVGDGQWTKGYDMTTLSCGRVMDTADVCNVTPQTPTNQQAPTAYRVVPFVQTGEQEFPVQCAPADAEAEMARAMDSASEYFVAGNFWRGDVEDWAGADQGLYLADDGIDTVSAGASTVASIVAALAEAYGSHPDLVGSAVVHLGLTSSYALPPGFEAAHPDVKFVESAGYPLDGVAVTGPVIVRLGPVESATTVDQAINRQYVSSTRFAAVAFDPCLAVVTV